jgi:nucleotide-binding universal stress UspA family protein
MPALRKILVGTDFSDQSDVALAQAAAIAQRDGRSLVLLYVAGTYTHVPPVVVLMDHVTDDVRDLIEKLDADAHEKLEHRAEIIRQRGVETECRVEHGHADEEIAKVADELGCDLIVMGTHGESGLLRTLLGSTTAKVVRTTDTNVLVARGDNEHVEDPFERILVPTDFSPASEKALQLAISMAAPTAYIELFHTWYYSAGIRSATQAEAGVMHDFRTQVDNANTEAGARLVERYAQGDLELVFRQDCGPAAPLIQSRCEQGEFDLVAVGTHGHRGFRRFLLGSVAEETIRHACCSVLVAHAERDVRTG